MSDWKIDFLNDGESQRYLLEVTIVIYDHFNGEILILSLQNMILFIVMKYENGILIKLLH